MGQRNERLHLALSVQGAGYFPGSWRHPQAAPPRQLYDPAYYYELAQTAERGKFDLLFLDHTAIGEQLDVTGAEPGLPLEPLTLLGALASVTTRIGLAAAVSTSVIEPFAVARQLAALDHLSGGRMAWLATAATPREPQRRFGGGPAELSTVEQRERLEEFVAVTARLWDSWEDGAVIADRAEGRYIDADKVHLIHHVGRHFRVRGPLSIPRPPQGHPVLIGGTFAAQPAREGDKPEAETAAELVFRAQLSLREAADFCARLKRSVARQGRSADSVKVLTAVTPILAATERDAARKAAELRELVEPQAGLAALSDWLRHDVTGYSPDGPPPAVPGLREAAAAAGLAELTLGELGSRTLELQGNRLFVGTPEQLADWMAEWHRNGGSDGFLLRPALLPGGLDDFIDGVVPELQRRGLFRSEYEGATLREHLGLPFPSSEPISKEGAQ